jgi:hypothetical protein
LMDLCRAKVGAWSKVACATLSVLGPISLPQVAKTLADGLGADLFFCDVLASLHRHLAHKVDLEGVGEIRGL